MSSSACLLASFGHVLPLSGLKSLEYSCYLPVWVGSHPYNRNSETLTQGSSLVHILACFGLASYLVRRCLFLCFFFFFSFTSTRTNLLTPNCSAEVIGLSLRTSGINGYLNVQAFTGAMFILSFLSCTFNTPRCIPPLHSTPLTSSVVWLLRGWKLQQLELLGLDNGQQPVDTRRSGLAGSYLRAMFTVRRL